MKKEITINGKKYRQVEEEEIKPEEIKGQSGLVFIMLFQVLFWAWALLSRYWLLSWFIISTVFGLGFVGIESITHLNHKIKKLESKNGKNN